MSADPLSYTTNRSRVDMVKHRASAEIYTDSYKKEHTSLVDDGVWYVSSTSEDVV